MCLGLTKKSFYLLSLSLFLSPEKIFLPKEVKSIKRDDPLNPYSSKENHSKDYSIARDLFMWPFFEGISKWFIIIFLYQYLNLKEIKSQWRFLKVFFTLSFPNFKERGKHPNGWIFLQHQRSKNNEWILYWVLFHIFT